MIVHILGAGGGRPTARRDTSGFVVRVGTTSTLVDCPGGVVHKLARLGIAPEELARVVITHDHTDHLYGLPHLLHAMAIDGDGPGVEILAPATTVARAGAVLEAFGLGEVATRIDWRTVSPDRGEPVVDDAALQLRVARAEHGRETLALRIDTGDASLGHSSDTLPCARVAELCQGVDLLLHDCAGLHAEVRARLDLPHSSAREAGEVAAAAGAARLGLVHLGAAAEADEAAVRLEASDAFAGTVDLVGDGDLYRLPGPRQTASAGADGTAPAARRQGA